jgi:hypothetical protein
VSQHRRNGLAVPSLLLGERGHLSMLRLWTHQVAHHWSPEQGSWSPQVLDPRTAHCNGNNATRSASRRRRRFHHANRARRCAASQRDIWDRLSRLSRLPLPCVIASIALSVSCRSRHRCSLAARCVALASILWRSALAPCRSRVVLLIEDLPELTAATS